MQLLIREKTEDMLNPEGPRNHLLKYLPPFLPNLLFVKSMKTLEPIHQRYRQIPKGPNLIPSHLVVSMKKKAEREKARPPKFNASLVSNKKKKAEAGEVSALSNDNKSEVPPEEVATIEVDPEEIISQEPLTPLIEDATTAENTQNTE